MLEVIVTGEPSGKKALMYSELNKKGLRKMVPTYPVLVRDEHGNILFEFEVTRLCRDEVFFGGKARDYRPEHECPPSRPEEPYFGRPTRAGRLKFAFMLYEAGCPAEETLTGQGTEPRKGIKIHIGPATSLGCMAVAGGEKGYRRFKRAFTDFQAGHGRDFRVKVLERTI